MKKRLAKKMKKRQTECVQTNVSTSQIEEVSVQAAENTAQTAEKSMQAPKETVKNEQRLSGKTKGTPADSVQDKEPSQGKAGQKVNIFYQFSQHQVERQEIINRIKNQWKSQGHMLKDLKDLVIYLKIEENKAYYVINESEQGCVTACE